MARLSLIFLLALMLAACGGSSGGGGSPDVAAAGSGLLRQVTDASELESSLKSALSAQQASGDVALSPEVAGGSAGGFSGTYTQEARVDEFDVVRYDGERLYIAPLRVLSCCFVLDALVPVPQPEPRERAIRILATDPASATARVVGTIPLEEGVSVQGMYLDPGRLFALTGGAFYGAYGEFWSQVAIWAPEKLGFRVYDTTDPAAPRLAFDASLDGVFIDSRRVGDTVYIVSRYAPVLQGLEYPVLDAEQAQRNQAALARLSLADLLPKITIDGETRALVDPQRCFLANGGDTTGYPVITTITAVPLDRPAEFSSTCYNEDAYGVYVSEQAIYLTQLRFDSARNRDLTRIHKFALGGGAPAYAGSAEVAGQVWRGGQEDFRMSESAGDLRVFATEYPRDPADAIDHRLYVLRQSPAGQSLDLVAQLPNERRPEEIGKAGEALYGVRFLGDRAYAVTFRRIDPLYVVDLADPADPRLAGRLEASGFSDFLHPVGDALLLGLGMDQGGGIKLELFDVSDLENPVSRGSLVLGGPGSYSEARYDRHAFAYLADAGGVDRFAIPAELYAEDGSFAFVSSGLHLFEIRDKANPAAASLVSAGALPAPDASSASVSRNRAFLHDDSVFYVRDETLWAARWNTPGAVNGPF